MAGTAFDFHIWARDWFYSRIHITRGVGGSGHKLFHFGLTCTIAYLNLRQPFIQHDGLCLFR